MDKHAWVYHGDRRILVVQHKEPKKDEDKEDK
jgi:hypothetical protein